MRCEDGCTRLDGASAIKLNGKRENLQNIQVLFPIRDLSLNPNVCGLRRCLGVEYSDKDLPLEETVFLDSWNVNSTMDYAKY